MAMDYGCSVNTALTSQSDISDLMSFDFSQSPSLSPTPSASASTATSASADLDLDLDLDLNLNLDSLLPPLSWGFLDPMSCNSQYRWDPLGQVDLPKDCIMALTPASATELIRSPTDLPLNDSSVNQPVNQAVLSSAKPVVIHNYQLGGNGTLRKARRPRCEIHAGRESLSQRPDRAKDASSSSAAVVAGLSHNNTRDEAKAKPRTTAYGRKAPAIAPRRLSLAAHTHDSGRVRTSHNQVEKNYRNRLNLNFAKLLEAVEETTNASGEFADGGDGGSPRSKGDVLNLARRRLVALDVENGWLRTELQQMKADSRNTQ